MRLLKLVSDGRKKNRKDCGRLRAIVQTTRKRVHCVYLRVVRNSNVVAPERDLCIDNKVDGMYLLVLYMCVSVPYFFFISFLIIHARSNVFYNRSIVKLLGVSETRNFFKLYTGQVSCVSSHYH